jgi:hypothetical protein
MGSYFTEADRITISHNARPFHQQTRGPRQCEGSTGQLALGDAAPGSDLGLVDQLVAI